MVNYSVSNRSAHCRICNHVIPAAGIFRITTKGISAYKRGEYMELQHHAICYLTDTKRKKSGHPSAVYGWHNIVVEEARVQILAAYEGSAAGQEAAKKKLRGEAKKKNNWKKN